MREREEQRAAVQAKKQAMSLNNCKTILGALSSGYSSAEKYISDNDIAAFMEVHLFITRIQKAEELPHSS